MQSLLMNPDLKSLLIGIAGAFIVLAIQRIWMSYRRSSVKQSLAYMEWEKSHFIEIQKSATALNRSSFRSLFYILFFISLAGTLHAAHSDLPAKLLVFDQVVSFFEIVFWFVAVFRSFSLFRLYSSFKRPEETIARMDATIDALKKRIGES